MMRPFLPNDRALNADRATHDFTLSEPGGDSWPWSKYLWNLRRAAFRRGLILTPRAISKCPPPHVVGYMAGSGAERPLPEGGIKPPLLGRLTSLLRVLAA